MRKKRRFVRNKRKRNAFIYSFFFMFLFISIGYATVSTRLGINGFLSVLGRDPNFEYDTWPDIVRTIRNGDACDYYSVGDTKEVDMGSLGTHTIRIANCSMPDECRSDTFSKTACGVVFEFVDIPVMKQYNSFDIGVYRDSAIREYLNGEFYNALPADLRNSITNTHIVSGGAIYSPDFTVTNDFIYLLSPMEVFGPGNYFGSDYASDYTRQLDYYTGLSTTDHIKTFEGTSQKWWLRSGSTSGSNIFHIVDTLGTASTYTPRNSLGVSPAFRIGEETRSFSTDSWEDIIDAAEDGVACDIYSVGDTKEVDLGSFGTHTVRIANCSRPLECDTTGFSQTACGFVLEFEDIITDHVINSTSTNVGGWPATSIRTYLNSDIYNALPTVLKNAIIDTPVVSGHGSTTGEGNFTSTDKLYLLSSHELWEDVDGNTSDGFDYYDTGYHQSRQLDYYWNFVVDGNGSYEAIKYKNGTKSTWNLRDAISNSTTYFRKVNDTNGQGALAVGDNTAEISFAFRLSDGIESSNFRNDDWEEIVTYAEEGTACERYSVGDTRTIDLGSFGTHTIRVANCSMPEECSSSGFSQTACGFVLEFADFVTTRAMNSTQTNANGWVTSGMRAFVNNDIYNALPTVLKNAIIDTPVVSGHGYMIGATLQEPNFTTLDKLYLLSPREVWSGESGEVPFDYDTATSYSRQLDYYDFIGVTTTKGTHPQIIRKYNDYITNGWMRTANGNNSTYFFTINYLGGWSVEDPTKVYGVAPAFRLGSSSGDFTTDSWEDIIDNAEQGLACGIYNVGDTKEIDLGSFGTHTLRIANCSTPSECSNTGFSQTACGFVIEFADGITTHNMNNNALNTGSWNSTGMKNYVNNEIYNALPSVVKDAIIDTTVVTGYGTNDSSVVTDTNKLYLLSPMEVWGNTSLSNWDNGKSYSRQLDYYLNMGVNSGNLTQAIKQMNGSNVDWWQRTPCSIGNDNFGYVIANGNGSRAYANVSQAVSPAFRLGPEPRNFTTDDWDDIVHSVQRGRACDDYSVGDTKSVDLGTLGVHNVRIANCSTPSECSTAGFSQTACGFVLEFVDSIETRKMYDEGYTDHNAGGWPATDMRNYLNTTLYNALPSSLKNSIIDTTVVSGHGSTAGETNFTSVDKLYLLTSHEVWEDVDGDSTLGIDYYDSAYYNTRQLDYYENLGVTTSNKTGAIKQYNGSNLEWWLRSCYLLHPGGFGSVYPNGSWSHDAVYFSYGVSPAFRLG